MKEKELAYKLEKLTIEAEKAKGLFLSLETSLLCGPHAVENYEWAMIAITSLLSDLADELEKIKEDEFNKLRRERAIEAREAIEKRDYEKN